MVHRIYDFVLPHSAIITNDGKDGVFIPAGFDSMRLISELGKMENKKKKDESGSSGSDEELGDDFEKPFEDVLNYAMF
jgi:hypothetical protein